MDRRRRGPHSIKGDTKGAAPQRCGLAYDAYGMWHIMVCQGQQHDIHTHILKLYAIILVGEHRHGQVPRTVHSEGPW